MNAIWIKLGLAASVAGMLVGCGGGGGSSGDNNLQYSITLRADRTNLPINISGTTAGQGVYSPYTTTLYVQAKEGNDPILGGEEIFSCNVAAGLATGSLYYLDGDDEHMVELPDGTKVPGAYRSIVLGANAGGSSFHFHSANEAGVARITCSVTDPRDNRVYSASVDINVGAATKKPASVVAKWQAPGYLGTQFNPNDIRNNVGLQVQVHDDANQPVPNPTAPNLQVGIVPTDASPGARLLSGSQSGSVIQVSTTAGVGQISVSSGPNRGALLLQMTSDRYDNDVTNGIQDPVTQLTVVPVVNAIATAPLEIPKIASLTAKNGTPYAYALSAEGGVAPYTWSAVGLPTGLSLSADGLISGTPNAPAGSYRFVVTVTDGNGTRMTQNTAIALTGATDLERAFGLNCVSASGNTCTLPGAIAGTAYSYTFSALSSDPAMPIAWSFLNLPSWLSGNAGTGTVSGTPPIPAVPGAGCPVGRFTVTATQGAQSATYQTEIEVTGPDC